MLDDGGRLFGAFASEALRCERHYFGTGETFLFSLAPSFAAYRWTRQNSHYVLGGHDSLAFGGGGAFGLYLDASFERGSSARCDTFGNEPLGSSPEFGVVKVGCGALGNSSHLWEPDIAAGDAQSTHRWSKRRRPQCIRVQFAEPKFTCYV